jgi:signal transduction histidine kinase
MGPVLAAAVGVAVLGTLLVSDAMVIASEADRAGLLAQATGSIGALAHEVAAEYVQTNEAKRPGRPPNALADQLTVTDAAVRDFGRANESIRAVAPDLANLAAAAQRSLGSLTYARDIARQSPDGSAEVAAYYDQILRSLVALADALPAQMIDTRLIELSRSVALVAELERLAALQLDLIARGLTLRTLQPAHTHQLAEWVGQERNQIDALSNLVPAAQLYADLISQTQVAEARSIRQVILDGRGAIATLNTDARTWVSVQSQRLTGLRAMGEELAFLLDAQATAVGTAARERTYVAGGLAAAIVATTLVGATTMAVRTSRRLRRTRYAALTAARIELPAAISNVTAARDAVTMRAALTESSARIDSMLMPGADEIGELATAFGAVHRQALRLAADQALLRMEVQAMFIALSRRGQTLVQRQIHLIDEFGRNEADPDALSRLFALDHLAARMRRNEENLLVLAGGEPGRWITRPVAVTDLIRAAAQETEEYRRVEIVEAPEVAVTASVAGDAIHLLAELLENATSFSPPSTTVRVSARRAGAGLLITVTDGGIGMAARNLAEANERLAHPSALTSTLVGTMGLLVVARLAQRHGIDVRLASVPAGGTTATVSLPDRLVTPFTEDDHLQPSRWLRDAEQRHLPPAAAAATSLPPLVGHEPGDTHVPAPRRPAESSPVPTATTEPPPTRVPSAEYPVVAFTTTDQRTAAGLPRRPADAPVPAGGAPDDRAEPLPHPTPDPETVRARLSSLASGLAAAHARPEAPTPDASRVDTWRDPQPASAVPDPDDLRFRS